MDIHDDRLRRVETETAILRARVEDSRDILIRHLNDAAPFHDRIRELEKLTGLMDQDLNRLQESVGATSGIRAHIDTMADRIKHLEEQLTSDQGKWNGARGVAHFIWGAITFIISIGMWYVGFRLSH